MQPVLDGVTLPLETLLHSLGVPLDFYLFIYLIYTPPIWSKRPLYLSLSLAAQVSAVARDILVKLKLMHQLCPVPREVLSGNGNTCLNYILVRVLQRVLCGTIQKLQQVQNVAARLFHQAGHRDQITCTHKCTHTHISGVVWVASTWDKASIVPSWEAAGDGARPCQSPLLTCPPPHGPPSLFTFGKGGWAALGHPHSTAAKPHRHLPRGGNRASEAPRQPEEARGGVGR